MTSLKHIQAFRVESITRSESTNYGKHSIESSKGLVRVLSFATDQDVSSHAHGAPGHEYFYVVKGRGTLFADGEQTQVEPGMILSVPTQVKHGWKNIVEEMLIISILMPEVAYKEAPIITAWKET